MKFSRNYFYIVISSAALLSVLCIQIFWIINTAKVKEQIFNEKANIVLSKTADALSLDKDAIKNLQISIQQNEVKKIDSLFRFYMALYKIKIDYYYELKPMVNVQKVEVANYNENAKDDSYATCISDEPGSNGTELKLIFPKKEQFIRAEMGIPFVSSVILIVIVFILSWRASFSLMKEKKIAQQTADFLSNMTHEFKTPLTNISLAGKMIKKETAAADLEKVNYYASIILDENQKLAYQVEQVLGMNALERGEVPLKKSQTDIHQLILDVTERMQLQLKEKNGKISTDLKAKDHVLNVDRVHLSNAITNLIDNSIKYSNENPEIRISTFQTEKNFIFTIEDNGIGIDREYQEKVFDKFFRVPTGDIHDVKGFGIGLSYVKAIVELHNGSIEVKSENDKGVIFTMSLPYA